jgi:YfiH family protein
VKNIIFPPNISMAGVKAFFSTKTTADTDPGRLLMDEFDISAEVYMPVQRHTDRVYLLESDMRPVTADAVITSRKNILIGIKVADCVPVLLLDKEKMIIGAVHAGWRGTASGILKRSISAMHERFGSAAGDILVAIGPSIKGCSYEVGRDVRDAVLKATGEGDYVRAADDRYLLDISAANKLQAISMDVPDSNIWLSEECTFCDDDKFHSYRRSGEKAGRQGGFIAMW